MLFRISAAVLPLAVGACAQSVPLPPADVVATAAVTSNIGAPLPPVELAFTPRPVTDPASWQAVNDAVTPGAAGDE